MILNASKFSVTKRALNIHKMMLLLLAFLNLILRCNSLPETIKLGRSRILHLVPPINPLLLITAGLFDEASGAQEAAFMRAVTAVNDDRSILTRSLVSADVGRWIKLSEYLANVNDMF